MSEETKKAPAIRFQGFTDDWEQRKLEEDISVVGGATPSKSNPDYWNGPIVWLSSQEIKEKYVSQGTYTITKKAVDDNTTKMVKAGTPLIVSRSGILARLFPISIPTTDVAINQDIKALIFDLNIINTNFFVAQLQKNEDFILRSIVKTGTTVQSINMPDFYKLQLSFPSMNEQEKVGKFFQRLDDTIALHLCKQRQLELLKQRLIKEILPQSDSTLPHLRFANFRKPWEQHQLKEVLKVNSGRDYKHLNEGNIPVYGTGGYMLSVDGKLSDVDGIGLGRKGTIDKPQYLKAPFWTVDTLFYLTPSPNYDIYFLYTLIQNVNWKSMDESTGVPSLSKSVIERVTLTFPILEEQQKIGSFFREFDNTISLHQQKIAHLKALKSTILNKMFI